MSTNLCACLGCALKSERVQLLTSRETLQTHALFPVLHSAAVATAAKPADSKKARNKTLSTGPFETRGSSKMHNNNDSEYVPLVEGDYKEAVCCRFFLSALALFC